MASAPADADIRERRILALTSVAHFFTHLCMIVYPTLVVAQARDWHVPVSDLWLAMIPGYVLYGLGAIPAGLWADRRHTHVPLIVGLIGMGAGAAACSAAGSVGSMAAGLGLMGLFASLYHPAGLGLITRGVRRSQRALGINGAVGSFALAVGPAAAEGLEVAVGWRGAFVAIAALATLSGLAFAAYPIRVAPLPPAAARPTDGSARLLSVPFLVLCVAMMFNGLAYRGNTTVLPTLFEARVGFIGHGVATSLTYSIGVLMNWAGGHLSERYPPRRVFLALHSLSLVPLALTAFASGLPLLLLAGVYLGCALGMQPAENGLVARLAPPARTGVAYGIKFTLSFGVGALAVPLARWARDALGWEGVQLLSAAFVAVVVVAALWLQRAPAPPRP